MSLAVTFLIKGAYQHSHVLCQSVTMLLSTGSASVEGFNIDFIQVAQHVEELLHTERAGTTIIEVGGTKQNVFKPRVLSTSVLHGKELSEDSAVRVSHTLP